MRALAMAGANGRLTRTLAGWRSGDGSLPATPAGVETCALTVVLGVRLINVCQLLLSLPTALRHTTSRGLFLAVLACYVVESGILATVVVRAGEYRDERWGRADSLTAVCVLLLQPAFIRAGDVTGSWTAWGFACTLGSACGAGIVFRRPRHTALAVASITAAYLIGNLPLATGPTRATVIANAFSYAGFALLSRLLVGFLRRLGAQAEEARRLASEAAAEAARLKQVDRQRTLLHDNISVLRLLARTDLPAELDETLRDQAVSLANKVRAFLNEARVPAPSRPPAPGAGAVAAPQTDRADRADPALTCAVREAAEGFRDLPMVLSLDLADGILLPEETAAVVRSALETLLHNVRLHASARNVVVHADADEAGREWEVSVRDDGRGFDPVTTPLGFGLRVQVIEALARHHIHVELDAHPRDGTTVVLRGPLGEVP
ncbi:ATP-binding protein [Streptomyces polygonati]|uniref:ATP-binding protein n=1 Tax=Streptomyces polygonati TaxID=1617087 RepID=A0ABV8HSV9_9ACTN